MTEKTTRRGKYSRTEATLFVAFELGWNQWKLGFSTGLGQKPRQRNVPARDLQKLRLEIDAAKVRFGLPQRTRVVSCYEAGRDGFWLHRYLVHCGVENVIVDSASIQVNRRARRAKTDSLDVESLLVMLIRYHLGERKTWSVVRVPTVNDEDGRHLHRELKTLQKERTRTTNRIKGLLANQGVRMTERRLDLSGDRLGRIRLWDGSSLPPALTARLAREWEHVVFLKEKIHLLETERRQILKESKEMAVEKTRRLAQLRAIGPTGAWMLIREFFAWRQFRNRRQVGALSGLVPTPYQSGASGRELGISKAGNRRVRGLMIELAWIWLRHQPNSRLSQWYAERFARAGGRARRIGIVAVARRLLIDLWRFVEQGVIPEGAELKA